MGQIVGESFDVVEAIRRLEEEIVALKQDVTALKNSTDGGGRPQPAPKKLQRAPSEQMT